MVYCVALETFNHHTLAFFTYVLESGLNNVDEDEQLSAFCPNMQSHCHLNNY